MSERFRKKFVRDDGLMDKYHYDKTGDPDFMADVILTFFHQEIKAFAEEMSLEEKERFPLTNDPRKITESYERARDWEISKDGYNTALKALATKKQELLDNLGIK